MKRREKIIIAIVVFVLTAIYMVQTDRPPIQQSASGGYTRLLPEDFSFPKIRKIELYRGSNKEQALVLEKEKKIWKVATLEGRVAESGRIAELFFELNAMQGELRGSEPGIFPVFLLSDKRAVHIVFYGKGGAVYLHLLVGKMEPVFGKRFVRFAGSNNIYLSNVKLSFSVGPFGSNNQRDPDHFQWLGQVSEPQESVPGVV